MLLVVNAMVRLRGTVRVVALIGLVLVQGGWGVYWSLRHMEVRYSVNDMNLRKLTFVHATRRDENLVEVFLKTLEKKGDPTVADVREQADAIFLSKD